MWLRKQFATRLNYSLKHSIVRDQSLVQIVTSRGAVIEIISRGVVI